MSERSSVPARERRCDCATPDQCKAQGIPDTRTCEYAYGLTHGARSSVPAREGHPVLLDAKPGDLVGVEVECPRYDCDWREPHASAAVVNEHGVRDPLPLRCPRHKLRVRVARIVEVIR